MTDPAHIFDSARPALVKLAYRMLGSVADAEDVVQTAFLRWRAVDPVSVQNPPAYLRRIVTRLCLDVHRTIARRREVYLGEWLPDPVVTDPSEDITLMLMLALERLSPLERAAFLLHDVFGVEFTEVSGIIDRTPPPPASWPPVRAETYNGTTHGSASIPPAASKSPPPSLPPPARATWAHCAHCLPKTSACTRTAAANGPRSASPSMAATRWYRPTQALPITSATTARRWLHSPTSTACPAASAAKATASFRPRRWTSKTA